MGNSSRSGTDVPRFDSTWTALAAALAGAVWLHQSLVVPRATVSMFVDRAIFLFVLSFGLAELLRAIRSRTLRARRGVSVRRFAPSLSTDKSGGLTGAWPGNVVGVVILVVLLVAQTLLHADERGAYLYMTLPAFPTGVGTGADGYVAWLDGHPVYAEAWQFGKLANLFSGAATDLDTGDHDARGAYSYLAALLARPLGFFNAFLAINVLFWLSACVAMWYLGRVLLGTNALGFTAALLAGCGQGFVFMSSSPMSYVAGYAWSALLLALMTRWCLFGWTADWRRWVVWGFVCGASGLFYFTHVVTVGAAWIFGASRSPLRGLVPATALALLIPAAWFAVATSAIGLRFQETTANDLFGQVRVLARLAFTSPLVLPSAAGEHSFRALFGGFYVPLLPLAALGVMVATPRRRQWYVAVAACGLIPVLVLHMIPVTQRYGYLAYPAVYLAATEACGWLSREVAGRLALPSVAVFLALASTLVAVQVFQANADLLGIYTFSVAFGGP